MAYDHPFCEGNGRTNRALFVRSMLDQEPWLSKVLSISSVINTARGKDERSFLRSESDDNDLIDVLLAAVMG